MLTMTHDHAPTLELNHGVIDHYYGRIAHESPGKIGNERLRDAFEGFRSQYRDALRLYIESLFHTLEFVDRSQPANREFYTSLIRSYLSRKLQKIVFYYVVGPEEGKPRKLLIEKYSLLIDFNFELLIEPEHRKLIGESAFKIV
jgi:hypothetical protein